MPRPRRSSTASSKSGPPSRDQELSSMYDYLAKIILLGPSGCGKTCLLHRYLRNEFRILTSQTIGVEFASKIVKLGTRPSQKRVKLQLWDTAGQERFRSVSRSYYRGAAGALLVYDVSQPRKSLAACSTFLRDAEALGSPNLAVALVGNKGDLLEEGGAGGAGGAGAAAGAGAGGAGKRMNRAAVEETEAWARRNNIPFATEVSALSGQGVDEVFSRIAGMILTKIELGEVDPDDPQCGIQYGDLPSATADAYASARGRKPGIAKRVGLSEWGEVFSFGGTRSGSRCC
ncbi:MAG: hypothetical protein M1831_001812 [Alyxoria varia]|nr:MAG: hypothetical protein M1831_001812 [Alyxoria varia]